MTQTTSYDAIPAMDPIRLAAVEVLLKRYPRTSQNEIREISAFLRSTSIIDRYLLEGDPFIVRKVGTIQNETKRISVSES